MVKHSRASGFRTILVCFLQIYECVDPAAENGIPVLRNTFKSIELFCSNAPALDAATKAHLHYVFEVFHELVEEDRSIFENNNYTTRQSFSPVELVAVACLISQKGAERPKGMLKGDILAMRAHLRKVHSDIRLNRPCWMTAWKFIDTIEHHRGARSGSTVIKRPPKIVKKKPRPDRSARSFTAVPAGSQAQSAEVSQPSQPMTANKDEQRLSKIDVSERLLNATGRISVRNQRGEHDISLNSPNNPPTNGFLNNGGDHVASSRTLSNAPASVASRMNSIALREGSVAESQRPRLPAFTSSWDKSNSERATSQGFTVSGSGTPLTPSAVSPTFGNTAGSMTAPPARKRVALDLGGGSSGTHELESKKARLMAGYLKQEKEG